MRYHSEKLAMRLLLAVCALILLGYNSAQTSSTNRRRRKDGHANARSVRIINDSGVKIDMFWIHPHTRKLAASNTLGEGVMVGSETGVGSFVGHEFEVLELPSDKTKKCKHKKCQKTYFAVTSNEDQWVTVTKDFEIVITDNKSRAMDKAKEALGNCSTVDAKMSVEEQIEHLSKCAIAKIDEYESKSFEEHDFQSHVRKDIGSKFAQYACVQDDVNTTQSVHNQTWSYSGKTIHIQSLFESDNSVLYRAKNFVPVVTCRAFEQLGNEKGSLEQKDMQRREISSFFEKLNEFFGTILGHGSFQFAGQSVLQIDNMQPDSDSVECHVTENGQSTCSVRNLKVSNAVQSSVASLFLYCSAPERGGVLYFPKTGTQINPVDVTNDAIIAVQFNAQTGKVDDDLYLDNYVQCPVQKGSMLVAHNDILKA